MAIAFDAASNVAAGNGTLSWTHTPSGTPKGVLVLIASASLTDQVDAVTYGGTAMTEVTDSPVLQTLGDEGGSVYGYFLGASIPTGPQTVVVTVTGAASKRAVAITVTAAADTAVEDTAAFTSAATTAPSATLTTLVETFVAGVLHTGVNAPTAIAPGADYTEVLEHDYGTSCAAWQRRTANAAAGSPVCDWATNSEEAAVLAVALKEAAGGGTPYTHSQPDTADVTDSSARSLTKAVADNISGSDTDAIAYVRHVADGLSITDTTANAATHPVADTGTLSDNVTTDTGGGVNWTQPIDDALSATDSHTMSVGRSQSDTATVTDSQARATAIVQQDTLEGTDLLARAWAAVVALSDTATVTDALVLPAADRWDVDTESRWPVDPENRWLVDAETRW